MDNFNPKFTYRQGKLNILPDFLSRNPINFIKEKNTITGKLDDLENQIYHLTRENWKEQQRKCPRLSGIIERLIASPESRIPPHEMIDGILYYVTDKHKRLLEVPNSMIISVLDLAHNSYLVGHPGQQRLELHLREKYTFPKMNKITTEFADRCKSCLEIKGRNPPLAKILEYPIPIMTFQKLHMDILGPLRKDSRTGHQYILVFKDTLTRYTELVPLRTRTAEEVADAFIKSVLCRHGCPEILVSDNAAEFTSRMFKEVCRIFKIKTFNIAARHPASNGLCERQNIGISTYLKHYVNDSHTNWVKYLSFCQAAINNTYHSGIRSTPHLILKTYQYRFPWELQHYASPYMEEGQKVELEKLEPYTRDRYMNALKIRDLARIHLQKAKDAMMQRQHKDANSRDIKSGDIVYLKAVKPIHHSNKFTPRWTGPHIIQHRISENRFMLRCRATGKFFQAHVDNFRITKPPFEVNNEGNAMNDVRMNNSNNNGPHPRENSRYSGNDNQYERITRSKSNAMKGINNPRGIHEVDEEDDDWLFKKRLQAQRGESNNNNNNNNNNIIISKNTVNNNESQYRINNSCNDIVVNRNNNMNGMLHHEGIIQQEPEQLVNERNIEVQPVRQNVVKQSSRRNYDSTYKPYSRTYTNYRTEPVITRSTTRAKATQ